MKPSGIGGMAVMEGVMMKNKDEYAVAVRKPNNEIAIEKSAYQDFSDKAKVFKLPIFRGMLAFVDSMVIGVKVLNYSASFFDEDDNETPTKKEKKLVKKKENKVEEEVDFEVEDVSITHGMTDHLNNIDLEDKSDTLNKNVDKSNALLMALAVLISIVMSVTLFMVLPVLLTNLISSFIENRFLIAFIEGIVRLTIFIGYVLLASRLPDIKRVFMYHGAEHKTINCLENGYELTVENVKRQSKEHKRCGTSFMLLVILISLIFFMILPISNLALKVLSRIVLVPFIAGISYEFIRFAGKNDTKLVQLISKPGIWMQGLTTKEPDEKMIEVAIASVGAVFDWKEFLEPAVTVEVPEKAKASKQQFSAKSKEITGKNVNDMSVKVTSNNVSIKNTVNTVKSEEINAGSIKNRISDEEDDEILKALDKFFDDSTSSISKPNEAISS
jgi:uncharacterized protein YqhQ